MDFEKFSKATNLQINREIKKILGEWRKETGKISKDLLPLVDKFIKSCEGGKGLRGVLVVLGWELKNSKFKNQNSKLRKEVYRVAAAYEIFHSAILAHDDVIDKSMLRRGQPSLYQALGGNHNGASQSICLGDCGFFLATKVLSETKFNDRLKVKALHWFSKVMLDTGLGQMLDINKADALKVMKYKTAKYSIVGPLVLGAILAGAGENLIRELEVFGESLGTAYQIQDDVLGVFGEEKAIGKPVTSDIEEGKNTLLFEQAIKNADENQKKLLLKLYGKGKIQKSEIVEVRKIFIESKALKFVQEEAERYKDQAIKVIPEIAKDTKMSTLLRELAEYLVERNK